MDENLLRAIRLIPPEETGEINFILNSPDFTDDEKTLLITDIISKIAPNLLQEVDNNE